MKGYLILEFMPDYKSMMSGVESNSSDNTTNSTQGTNNLFIYRIGFIRISVYIYRIGFMNLVVYIHI